MSTGFPTSLDTYTVKNSGDTLQPAHVNDIQDAVSALEVKVGVDGSSVATSHTKKIADLVTLLGSCTAADLQKLHDLTATALELNIMDGVTATTAELNKMDGVTGSTAEINAAVDAIKAATTQGDLLVRGSNAIERLAAVAATQYLKSAGAGANPTYSKLALRDTGVAVGNLPTSDGPHDITLGFKPSVMIFLGHYNNGISIGFTNGNNHMSICSYQYDGSIRSGNSFNYPFSINNIPRIDSLSFSETGFTCSKAGGVNSDVLYLALP